MSNTSSIIENAIDNILVSLEPFDETMVTEADLLAAFTELYVIAMKDQEIDVLYIRKRARDAAEERLEKFLSEVRSDDEDYEVQDEAQDEVEHVEEDDMELQEEKEEKLPGGAIVDQKDFVRKSLEMRLNSYENELMKLQQASIPPENVFPVDQQQHPELYEQQHRLHEEYKTRTAYNIETHIRRVISQIRKQLNEDTMQDQIDYCVNLAAAASTA